MKKTLFLLNFIFIVSILSGQPPKNDLIQNATLVNYSPFVDEGVYFGSASNGDGEQMDCDLSSNHKVIYYKLTATSSNPITITLKDSRGYDLGESFAIVYSADDLNATTESQLTAVTDCAFGSATSFTPIVGENYYVIVHRTENGYPYTDITIEYPQDINSDEKSILLDFYQNTDGDNWTNNNDWNSSNLASTWFGVTVKEGHVFKIILESNNLIGTIPSSIINLPYLEEIKFRENYLNGSIPNFNSSSTIKIVDITKNDFSFADFEDNFISNIQIPTFNYQRQNLRDSKVTIDGQEGNNYTLIMEAIEGTDVTYQWYKKRYNYFNPSDEVIAGANENIYEISNFEDEDFDVYFCKATSPNVPGLALYRNTIEIKGEVSAEQKDALIALYNATNGDDWNDNSNWLSAVPVSEWFGVTVTGNKITELDFLNNNLTGSLPPEIGNLKYLQFLSFYLGNNIGGTLPQEIGNLAELRVLSLETNNFEGEIPDTYKNLTKLRALWLNDNKLSGIVPEFIATDFPNLVFFAIDSNNFHGKLPDFSSLEYIKYVSIPNNHFRTSDFAEQFQDYLNLDYSWNNSYNYSPQRTFDPEEEINSMEGATVYLNANVSNNSNRLSSSQYSLVYSWYKDGDEIPNSNQNPLIINNVQVSDSGIYHCVISDNTIPNFVINRAPITLQIGSLGLNELDINQIKVSPNPTSNYINIKTPDYQDLIFTLYDLQGKLILSDHIESSNTKIDMSSLKNGIYILNLKSNNIRVSKKIIKK